jgi:hypothetical protein
MRPPIPFEGTLWGSMKPPDVLFCQGGWVGNEQLRVKLHISPSPLNVVLLLDNCCCR